MDTFAFIIHPIDPKRDVSRKFPLLGRLLSERQIDFFSTFFPPVYISEIEGIASQATGKEIKGWFIACPYTPRRMLQLPERTVYHKIVQTGHMAEKLGAQILGLGAYTSVVGDAGVTIANALDVPVTTGDSYTVVIAVDSIREAAQEMNIPLGGATAAVVGASGAIGRVCAELLADDVERLYLIGRRQAALEELRDRLQARARAELIVSTQMDVLAHAQLILTVTSALHDVIFGFWRGRSLRSIEPRLKPGGKYEMATLELVEGTPLLQATVSQLAKRAAELNGSLGNPTQPSAVGGKSAA